jgi:hypothetical protein
MSDHKIHKPFFDSRITPSNKKYSVYVIKNKKPRLIHFGDRNMEHYHDKIGRWSSLNHNDKERRKRYLARAMGIKNKSGRYTYKDINSANYYSVNYLW